MKRLIFRTFFVSILLFLFSSSFSPAAEERPASYEAERVKVLSFIIRQHLSRHHFSRKTFDDSLSQAAFSLFLEQIDYQKRFLTQSDVLELKAFENLIDDEMVLGQVDLPVVSHRLMKKRVEKAEQMVDRLLRAGLDFNLQEQLETDPKKRSFCATASELAERWRKLLKYQTIINYLEISEQQREEGGRGGQGKGHSEEALWQKAQEKTRKSFQHLFSRLRRQDIRTYYSLYLNAVARAFDPHTNYLDPNTEEDFDISMKGSLEGIGASLREDDGFIKVVEIIPGSAAARQGQLAKEDTILKVAQGAGEPVDVSEMRLRDAVRLIRGKKGTEVRLTAQKPNGDILVVPIVRDVVNIEATFVKMASLVDPKGERPRFGYIHIPAFYRDLNANGKGERGRNATDDFRAALETLQKDGVRGLIIDLRNDGGGALQDAVNIAGLFIDKGPIVQVKDSQGQMKTLSDPEEGVVFGAPVVVLVNKFSASASEILAAALQDYGRAVILGGEHTHGKGTVQALIDLDQGYFSRKMEKYGPLGALKVTIQKFYRVNGDSTQSRGVIPDIVLPDRLAVLESGERYLTHSLPWDRVPPVHYEPWPAAAGGLDGLRRESLERVEKNSAFARILQETALERKKIANTLRPLSLDQIRAERKALEQIRNGKELRFEDYQVREAGLSDQKESALSEQLVRDPYVQQAFLVLRELAKR
ncbi:MAG: carboxy terminal-processing peptidase [Deltaproteobacteria bacterium]|nr:carboxy terminal-processing peptidase [Deltaproteobacteria bacterium]